MKCLCILFHHCVDSLPQSQCKVLQDKDIDGKEGSRCVLLGVCVGGCECGRVGGCVGVSVGVDV